ncbi:MAG: UDP-N-acetylglucosamine 2-epimerase [Candidatus Margulisiibacteriota bacterium]
MKQRRKICVVTGSRAEYGLLKPVMLAIRARPELKLSLIATGMHLSSQFGRTAGLIQQDGFRIDQQVKMDPANNDGAAMAKAIGRGITGLAAALSSIRPDVTLVLGDRTEALAASIASAYMNIAVAHIHGGDISMAGLDESARHAITKLAHIHFPASKESKERIIKLGEEPKRVFLVGAPGLDTVLHEPLLSKKALAAEIGFDFTQPVLVLLQHSVTTQIEQAGEQIKGTIAAVRQFNLPTVVIYPNSDAGGRTIIREIEKLRTVDNIRLFKNLPRRVYLSLLKYTSVLVGNSSGGIIETPLFKLPVVNIGIRQAGRERGKNVIDVPHKQSAIIKAIKRALFDDKFHRQIDHCVNPYGSGRAGEKIAAVLSKIGIDRDFLQKQITY